MRKGSWIALVLVVVAGCSERSLPPLSPSALESSAAGSAAANTPVQGDESYISQSCGFDVRVDLSGKFKEVALPGGRFKVLFPGYRTGLTNVSTGKAMTLSTTGSFHISESPDGNVEVTYTGRNSYDDPFTGRLLLLIGRFSEVFGPDEQPLEGVGQIIDLCEALR